MKKRSEASNPETMFVYEECSLDEQIVLAGFMPSSMVCAVCGGTAPLKARMYGITRFIVLIRKSAATLYT